MITIGLNLIRNRAARVAGCLIAAAALCSCIKEELPDFDDAEGRPTTVAVALELPAMEIRTRAMMSEKDDSQVNTLWVGTFQASTGKLTGRTVTDAPNHSDIHQLHPVTIDTKSGPSYIVGVANIDNNYGTTDDETLKKALEEAGKQHTEAGYYILRDLLETVSTWEQYKSIKAAHINPANVSSFTPNLIMAGLYHESPTSDPATWGDATPVAIPAAKSGTVTLPGAIHLRRLLAYVRFDIRWEGGDGITGLDVDLKSWKVVNNPTFSYVHEQQANAGDAVWENGYAASNLSRNFETTTRDNRTYRSFDFYQYENRHTGLDNVTTYNEREREHKRDDGTNSGIYASLCPEASDGPANRATYVEIEAEVAYRTTIGDVAVDRTGTARYVVHLGYCEGDDEPAKAKDFNCRRNTKYTYTVVIKGLDKIVVEARRDGEEQPGAKGEVFDTYEQTIDLDAHYGTFNIRLTDEERASLDYTIHAPYADAAENIVSSEYRKAGTAVEELIRRDGLYPYYQWIRFRPTTGENVLAKFKSSATDTEPWTLEQLRDVANYPHTEGTTGTGERWYTVFIDEYVYHGTADDGNEEGNEWWHYVNKDPRTVYLAIRESNVSTDGESRYGYSKYMIRQQSIQTYYATSTVGGSQVARKALGIEHSNETYGLNMRWTLSAYNAAPGTDKTSGNNFSGYGWNADNGRINIASYINKAGADWDDYVDWATSGSIPKPKDGFNAAIVPHEGKYYLPQSKTAKSQQVRTWYNNSMQNRTITNTGNDPNSSNNFYEAIALCLSRNRDLNGNGTIDPEEVRWYLPALGKYTRMVLGRQSLQNPLLDPNEFSPGDFQSDNNGTPNPWFHYVSSDGMILLNEQGLSLERKGVTGEDWMNSAWQIRCIRNLGCDMRQFVEEDPVERAYRHDPSTRTFEMTYYDQSSIRQQAVDAIPMHPITSEWNLPYKKFQYAQQDCEKYATGYNAQLNYTGANGYILYLGLMTNNGNANYQHIPASAWEPSNNANSICGQYSEEADGSDQGKWRVPNQKELTIMRREMGTVFQQLPGSNWMWQWISCSHFFIGSDTRVAGIYYNNGRANGDSYWGNGYMEYHAQPTSPNIQTYTHVRCVRDVVE